MTTAEIRWFFEGAVSFESLLASLSFSKPSERVDYYLLGTGERLGVKWREGSVEAKQQQGGSEIYEQGRLAGEIELWKKWSFRLDERASYSDELNTQPQHWLAIRKQRQQATFAYDARTQAVSSLSPGTETEEGCELEGTTLIVAGKSYTTIGLEASGQHETLRQNLVATIDYLLENGNLEGLDLSLASSSSYARWIHTRFCHTTS